MYTSPINNTSFSGYLKYNDSLIDTKKVNALKQEDNGVILGADEKQYFIKGAALAEIMDAYLKASISDDTVVNLPAKDVLQPKNIKDSTDDSDDGFDGDDDGDDPDSPDDALLFDVAFDEEPKEVLLQRTDGGVSVGYQLSDGCIISSDDFHCPVGEIRTKYAGIMPDSSIRPSDDFSAMETSLSDSTDGNSLTPSSPVLDVKPKEDSTNADSMSIVLVRNEDGAFDIACKSSDGSLHSMGYNYDEQKKYLEDSDSSSKSEVVYDFGNCPKGELEKNINLVELPISSISDESYFERFTQMREAMGDLDVLEFFKLAAEDEDFTNVLLTRNSEAFDGAMQHLQANPDKKAALADSQSLLYSSNDIECEDEDEEAPLFEDEDEDEQEYLYQ